MAISLVVLKTEIDTDPTGLGFASHVASGDHSQIAALLNEINTSIQVDRELVPAHEVASAVVASEYGALTARERERYAALISTSKVNVKSQNTRDAFLEMFPAGSTTRANLATLQTKDGSRAEQVLGEGVSISHADVSQALRS